MILNNVNIATPLLSIVPAYTAIFGLMFIYLSICVIKQRRIAKVKYW